MHSSSLQAGRYFPDNHRDGKVRPAPSEMYRKADQIRNIKLFTAQVVQKLSANGQLEGLSEIPDFRFVRAKIHEGSFYLDIHGWDGISQSSLINIQEDTYEQVMQLIYLHQKQRKYTNNRTREKRVQVAPSEYETIAFHFLGQKLKQDTGNSVQEVLGGIIKKSLQEVRATLYPSKQSNEKDQRRYRRTLEQMQIIHPLLLNTSLSDLGEIRKIIGQIIKIQNPENQELTGKMLIGIIDWIKSYTEQVKELALSFQAINSKNPVIEKGRNKGKSTTKKTIDDTSYPIYEGHSVEEAEGWEQEYRTDILSLEQNEKREEDVEVWKQEEEERWWNGTGDSEDNGGMEAWEQEEEERWEHQKIRLNGQK